MHSFSTRVAMSDIDASGTQTPLSMVTMMQNCSLFWLESEPEFDKFLHENDAAMLVVSRQVDIIRRPKFGERLTVSTWMYNGRGKMGYRNTVIKDEQGEFVAKCWALGVFATYKDSKMLTLPEELLQKMTFSEKLDMEYCKRKIVLPKVEPVALSPIATRRSDIDFNNHVNNAQYVRMAYDLLPQDFNPTRMRVMHDGQARIGDILHPVLYQEGNRYVYCLNDDNDKPYATVEWE